MRAIRGQIGSGYLKLPIKVGSQFLCGPVRESSRGK